MDNFGFSSGSGFEIVTEGRVYCLWASKEAEQLAWVNGLLARLDKKKKFVASGDEWMASLRYACCVACPLNLLHIPRIELTRKHLV